MEKFCYVSASISSLTLLAKSKAKDISPILIFLYSSITDLYILTMSAFEGIFSPLMPSKAIPRINSSINKSILTTLTKAVALAIWKRSRSNASLSVNLCCNSVHFFSSLFVDVCIAWLIACESGSIGILF